MASSSSSSSSGPSNEAKDSSAAASLAKQDADSLAATELDLDKNPIKYRHHDGSLSTEAHDKEYLELTLRSGKHSELVKQLMRQRIEQRAKEFPRWPGSNTAGVRALWIESRFWYDRERLGPDFDSDWRSYRARYLHSLELDPREPVHVPEYETEFLNPIRRAYMRIGDFLEYKIINRFVTKDRYKSAVHRVTITRMFMGWCIVTAIYYHLRYNHQKWDKANGPILAVSAPKIGYGHPKFPFQDYRTTPHDHHDQNFSRRNIYKDLRDFEDTSVVL